MQQEISEDVEATLKGDVYEIESSTTTGVIFREAKRNITFANYCTTHKFQGRSLGSITAANGYYQILEDIFANFETSKAEASETTGIFVLRTLDRKVVAEAVRSWFGAGSKLMKAPSCSGCKRSMDRMDKNLYHCPVCHATQQI